MTLGRIKTPVTSSRITVGTSPTAVAIHGRLLANRSRMERMFPYTHVSRKACLLCFARSATPARGLYPAAEFVIDDLERLHRHGLESGDAPVQVLRSLQHVRNRHRCDVHAEFAEDSDRTKHMKIAGKQYLLARHGLDLARRFNSVFACRGGMPFCHYVLPRNPLHDEEV